MLAAPFGGGSRAAHLGRRALLGLPDTAGMPLLPPLRSRRCMDATGHPRQEQEILTIEVKAGWKKGTKITFQEKGERAGGLRGGRGTRRPGRGRARAGE